MLRVWGCKRKGKSHPGCNPCSLSRKHLDVLARHRYLITNKSDGVRYALFLTTRAPQADGSVSPIAIMVDRAFNMYEIEVLAPEDFFVKDTLLEGELVWQQPNEKNMIFLVFDAVQVKGVSYVNSAFEERLQVVRKCTCYSNDLQTLSEDEMLKRIEEEDTIVMMHYDPPLNMRPKRFVELKHVVRLWEEQETAAIAWMVSFCIAPTLRTCVELRRTTRFSSGRNTPPSTYWEPIVV